MPLPDTTLHVRQDRYYVIDQVHVGINILPKFSDLVNLCQSYASASFFARYMFIMPPWSVFTCMN